MESSTSMGITTLMVFDATINLRTRPHKVRGHWGRIERVREERKRLR